MVYIGLTKIMPGEKIRHRVIRFGISYLISFAYVYFVTEIILRPAFFDFSVQADLGAQASFDPLRFYPLFGTFVNNTVILFLAVQIYANLKNNALQQQVGQLEIASLKAQQEQLKQNIHPHFLFNTMATLSALIEKDSQSALQYSLDLSKFLRTSLLLAKSDQNKIEDEIELLNDYLNLQKVRFRDALHCHIEIPAEIRLQRSIPVFSLQVLAENAIKHNALSQTQPITITIAYQDDHLTIHNNLVPLYNPPESTGTGLQNLAERFQLLGLKPPEIQTTQTDFRVKIQIL